MVETITSNGTKSFSGEWKDASITVDVHPRESLSETYTTNGTKTITGEFNGGSVNVDVHPSDKLIETITSNGTTSFSGEWKDADITVDVHPTDKLVKTITNNGTTDLSGEWKDASITVAVTSDKKPETICEKVIQENGSYNYVPEPFEDIVKLPLSSVFGTGQLTVISALLNTLPSDGS